QTVTISDTTAGAVIYYTTNGTTPNTASTRYTAPVKVNSTATLKAIAAITTTSSVQLAAGSIVTSPVATAAYTIQTTAATPVFSLSGGVYNGAQTLTISDSTSGAAIYYTTNGTSPTTSSTRYTGAIKVSATETIHAIAVLTHYKNSAIAAATYTITDIVSTPTLSVAGGKYSSVQTVTIKDASAGAAIYYTTNGTTPTASSTKYTAAIKVASSETIRAIAILKGYTNSAIAAESYTLVAATPTFSVAGGTYSGAQTVTIEDATAGAAIYYTTNGSTPTTASTKYSAAIKVATTETIHAIAILGGFANSVVATSSYTLEAATPAFSIKAGTYTGAQSVTLSDATAGATIYYTTNGSTPTTSSTKYTAAIKVSATGTIHAVAVLTNYKNSVVATAAYIISSVTTTPVFSLASGTYYGAQTVAIADAAAGSTIYYTTNGATPTTASTKYTGAFKISASETIHAIAVAAGDKSSAVAIASYSLVMVVAAPTLSHATGTFSGAIAVTISDSTPDAIIYYTTNGTTPTTSSARYTAPITVNASETVQAIATRSGMTNSALAPATYTITTVTPAFATGVAGTEIILRGNAAFAGNALRLTDGASGQISAAWFSKKVSVSNFTTDFTFQLPTSSGDGFTFVIQNAPAGNWASGGNGASLGYGGITKSVAIKFDLYNNAGEGSNSTGIYTNGAVPTLPSVSMPTSQINLHGGHTIQVHLVYNGTTLTQTMTDLTTKEVFTHAYTVNIPSVVGATTAFVGFTGSTGAYTSTQDILTWTYTE
ncbi:chitobiase/beta-hexosaminidase C-terminal domain-containing protein, partial [Acidicapsa ligni]|uniref:chitobiase/beta-hexosaminidase C-terminal domain-containing protein n=1 Tax=Acidicapsa ligni TaxID=542300 RepID=UPI0021E05BFD